MSPRQWRIDVPGQSMVLSVIKERLPSVVYWGAPLTKNEDLAEFVAATDRDDSGATIGIASDLTVCPLEARSFPGQPGIYVTGADGCGLRPDFRFVKARQRHDSLTLIAADDVLGMTYSAHFTSEVKTGVIRAVAVLESRNEIRVRWLAAPVLPAPLDTSQMIGFGGKWCAEFQAYRHPFLSGVHMRESRGGRSGHANFPGLYLCADGTTNTSGPCYALSLGWSGGHRMLVEELADGRRQIQFGRAIEADPPLGKKAVSGPLYLARGAMGLNTAAQRLQKHVYEKIVAFPKPSLPRPVHYNCWEAVYFCHDLDELKEIATRAAALGAERFVLDDGWFCARNDDTQALGDWQADVRKYPDGLLPLAEHVLAEGMQFGLWVEPEMISRNSALYRAHPDWVLGPDDQIEHRHQRVLDLGLKDVRDHLFDVLSEIVNSCPVSYLKWDHNRPLPYAYGQQTDGLYELLARLRTAFPDVEIESCASGGARLDYAMLEHCQRLWLSDSNDALERLRIQHEAALFLPLAVSGSHVGARRCHTSNRELPISFRAWVAAQRLMGFEMDVRELSENEAAVLRDVTSWWKQNRNWRTKAAILRLDTKDDTLIAEMQVANDGGRFVVFAGQIASPLASSPCPLRLTGLDANARYRVTLRNRNEDGGPGRGQVALKTRDLTLDGQSLMTQGLSLPVQHPAHIWVIEGTRLKR